MKALVPMTSLRQSVLWMMCDVAVTTALVVTKPSLVDTQPWKDASNAERLAARVGHGADAVKLAARVEVLAAKPARFGRSEN